MLQIAQMDMRNISSENLSSEERSFHEITIIKLLINYVLFSMAVKK